ncbi:Protein FAR1-RELATED SEQUENCE 2 [Glycine max]|nr:Protein FAR1-RELATED SEQUENCE 2 [Glycine max]
MFVVYFKCKVESAHWDFKRVLQNSVGDLCSVWDAMNNMITLQHVEIKASFETSTHVVGHVYKKTLYKRLLGMVSRDALNQIAFEIDRLRYLGNNLSSCGCVMRSTHGLPCACELSRYTAGSIPLESVHLFWRRLCFSDQGLCETEVTIKEEIEVISKRFGELDVAGKVTLKSKLREIAYPDHNSMCPPPSKVNTKGAPKKPMKRSQTSTKRDPSYWEYVDVFHSVQSSNSPVKRSASCSQPRQPTRIIPMLDQFASFFQGFICDFVDVKADGNCGYQSIAALLGMGEDSWSLVRNELLKELGRWSHEYMNLFGGTERFEQLKLSLLVDGFSKVSVDKWMDITDMGYVIASRYNVILVSLSQQQSMTFFPLRSQPSPDSSGHRIICVDHVFGNHFVQVYLKDHCPLPPPALLWSSNCYSQAKQWAIPYISRMQQYTSLMSFKTHYMDEDEWMYEIMSERANMDYENAESCGANEPHVDCSDAFKTSQVFECLEDVLRWARSVTHENGFVAVILRSDTNTGSKGKSTFVLIGCERSGEYKCRKKEFIRRDTGTRKCGGWMVKLICGVHNHELAKSLVGHPYAGRLTKAEKTLIADMTKSMDEDVVRDIFWCHPDSVKLVNACNLVFLIDNTYKTNRYRLPLLDFVGVTPTGMTFSAGFAYVEGERVNNLAWALQRFRGLFLKRDALPGVIVTDKDQALMNAVKDVFPECTNLLCIFHINKNVKAKCKSLIAQKNAWDYVMDCWGSLTDCPSEQQFDECLKKFEVACAPWPIFVDYVKETWIIPHKEKFVFAWTNKVMHLGNTTTSRVESAHSSLKRLLQNSIGDLCSVWDTVNNMITLQHTQIKASFETSTHVVGHVFQKTLYRRLLGMVSRYALNQIVAELERVHYAGKNPSSCGCVVITTLGLPCACELSKYVSGCIPLDSIHMFWRRLSFSDQGLSEPEVSIKDVMKTIYQKFEELDVCGKFTLRSKLWEIAHPDQNSMCPPPTKGAPKKTTSRNLRSTKRDPSYLEYVDAFESKQNNNSSVRRTASSSEQPNQRTMMPMLDQFQPFMHDFIDKIVDLKGDGNCGYRSVSSLLGMGQDSWSVVRNHLLKELVNFSEYYIKLFGGTKRFEELRMSLLVDGLTKVTTDKWMDITDMGHVIASRYNVIVVSLSKQQSMTFFPLRSQPLTNSSLHRIICIGHVYDNHFIENLVPYRLYHCYGLAIVIRRRSHDQIHILAECIITRAS